MTSKFSKVIVATLIIAWSSSSAFSASYILDGSFELQAASQNLPHFATGPNGAKWGLREGFKDSNGNWSTGSWRDIVPTGSSWVGGQICRTEDFTTGWKHAHDGDVFGIIKDRQSMSLTFTATADHFATLNWFDAGRNSWDTDTFFGRPNDYNVTIMEYAGATQTIGSFTSTPFGGTEANSNNNSSDARFDLSNRQSWVARTSSTFLLQSGRTYTLSFNSLSPFDSGSATGVEDRTTLLDSISMSLSPVPEPTTLAILGIGGTGLLLLRRRRK